MKVIKMNSRGEQVKIWQLFLIGQELLRGFADGMFGPKTDSATRQFQEKYNLIADGIVGQLTYAKAMTMGFPVVEDLPINKDNVEDYYWNPPLPNFKPLVSNAERQNIFGIFKYRINSDNQNITIIDGWQKNNIIGVTIKQLSGISGATKNGFVYFHRMAAKQLQDLFNEWEKAGLISLVLSWQGSFVPRLVRSSKNVLSNHAFGSAFDINLAWNQLGAMPAKVGENGSVKKLVPLANKFGFYWGGHYSNRQDGMHFEVSKIM